MAGRLGGLRQPGRGRVGSSEREGERVFMREEKRECRGIGEENVDRDERRNKKLGKGNAKKT